MNLLSPSDALPIRRILAIACVVLLGATVVLGSLLKASYEARGRLSGQVEALSEQLAREQKENKLYAKSEKITDSLQAEANKEKQEIRQGTLTTIQALCKRPAKDTPPTTKENPDAKADYVGRDDALDPYDDGVLRAHYSKVRTETAP